MTKESYEAQQRYFARLAERAHEAERLLSSASGFHIELSWKKLSEERRGQLTTAARLLYDNPLGEASQMSRLCILGEPPELDSQRPEMYKCGPQLVNSVEGLVRDIVHKKPHGEIVKNWDRARKGDWFKKI